MHGASPATGSKGCPLKPVHHLALFAAAVLWTAAAPLQATIARACLANGSGRPLSVSRVPSSAGVQGDLIGWVQGASTHRLLAPSFTPEAGQVLTVQPGETAVLAWSSEADWARTAHLRVGIGDGDTRCFLSFKSLVLRGGTQWILEPYWAFGPMAELKADLAARTAELAQPQED